MQLEITSPVLWAVCWLSDGIFLILRKFHVSVCFLLCLVLLLCVKGTLV
jgi:hypothetical protein